MPAISRYIVVPASGETGDEVQYETFQEARRVAEVEGSAVIERTYSLDDEVLCWTPDGSSEWPPRSPKWES